MNVFEKLIDILIGICIMLLFPVMYFNKKSELILYEALESRMNEFIQEVSTKGRLTKNGYEQFYDIINSFDLVLKVDIEYEEYRYEPEYRESPSSHSFEFTGKVYQYLNIIPNDEIIHSIYETGTFNLNAGGYIRVSVTVVKDNRTIYSGGAVRADLSLCDPICNHCHNICYHT